MELVGGRGFSRLTEGEVAIVNSALVSHGPVCADNYRRGNRDDAKLSDELVTPVNQHGHGIPIVLRVSHSLGVREQWIDLHQVKPHAAPRELCSQSLEARRIPIADRAVLKHKHQDRSGLARADCQWLPGAPVRRTDGEWLGLPILGPCTATAAGAERRKQQGDQYGADHAACMILDPGWDRIRPIEGADWAMAIRFVREELTWRGWQSMKVQGLEERHGCRESE